MPKAYIIAEAAQGYEGSVDIARRLSKGAAKAGADAIKFQVVFADDLCEPGYQYYDLFRQLEMPLEAWRRIREDARKQGIDFIVDVFGTKSLELAIALDVDAFKLHSTTFFDEALAQAVLAQGKTTYISVGGIEQPELEAFVQRHALRERGRVAILFGYQSEPTPIDKNNLARIGELRRLLNLDVGFMDHSEAGSAYDVGLSLVALGAGVRVFEKHITLDREVELEDYVSGLAPGEFARYVAAIRGLSEAFGSSSLSLSEDEFAYRGRALKRVVASRDIEAGHALTEADLRLSRPAVAGGSYKLSEVLGRSLKRPIRKGDPIGPEVLAS